jgi:hypothetical protein
MKFLSTILIIMAIVCGCGFFSTERYFQGTLPRSLDEKSGHIYPKNNHGVVVYYSLRELCIVDGLFFGGAAIGLIGGVLWRRQEKNGSR